MTLPRGATYSRMTPDGSGKWTSTYYYVNSFKDPSDQLKVVTTNSALQAGSPAPSPGRVTFARGESVTLAPTDPLAIPNGVIRDINNDGTVSKSTFAPYELAPNEYPIGIAGTDYTAPTANITNDGSIDTVRIAGRLTGPLTINWPYASNYPNSGQRVYLLDASGTVGPSHTVTIASTKITADTFSGQPTYVFDEASGQRTFVSDGAGSWNIPVAKGTILPFAPSSGNSLTISGNTSAIQHNHHWNLGTGANNLLVTNPYDGMQIELVLVQPSAQGTLNLPAPSYVARTGNGAVTLSNGGSKIDRLHGEYDANVPGFFWDIPRLDHTTGARPAVPTTLTTTGITSGSVALHWIDASTTEQGFHVYRALTGTQGYSLLGQPYPAGSTPASATGGTIDYIDFSVTANTTYDYKVFSYNAAGESNGSASTTGVVIPNALTADVWEMHLNDGATNSNATQAQATVPAGGTATVDPASWVVPGADGATGSAWVGAAGMTAMSSSVAATCSGTCTTTYNYRVFAYTASGKHNATTQITTGATAAAALGGANFNTITWTAVTGANHYEIYRVSGPPSTGKIVDAGNIAQATVTYTDTGLSAFRVNPCHRCD